MKSRIVCYVYPRRVYFRVSELLSMNNNQNSMGPIS